MSHALSIRNNGFVEHAHVGEKGWHGLGNQLEAGATIEQWRAAPGESRILELFQGAGKGAVMPGSLGTAWGLVNAVTEYVDHESRAKSADHRFQNAMFGKGDELKTDAFRKAFLLAA